MKTIEKRVFHLAQEKKEEGVWLPPESAAPYFRNGKGVSLNTLLNNLRKGKLDDVAYRDAFGWWVFIPQRLIDKKDIKTA